MIIVETNSCPSGQKSMPLPNPLDSFGGYREVIQSTFINSLNEADPDLGSLAVVFDKNEMEASGYASVLADITDEDVYLVEYHVSDKTPLIKFEDDVMWVFYCQSNHSFSLILRVDTY